MCYVLSVLIPEKWQQIIIETNGNTRIKLGYNNQWWGSYSNGWAIFTDATFVEHTTEGDKHLQIAKGEDPTDCKYVPRAANYRDLSFDGRGIRSCQPDPVQSVTGFECVTQHHTREVTYSCERISNYAHTHTYMDMGVNHYDPIQERGEKRRFI